MLQFVAGADSSTQATKVLLCDLETGTELALGRSPHPPTAPPRSEQAPAAWLSALAAALQEALSCLAPASRRPSAGPEGRALTGISVAAQQHGLVVLGEHGQVLRPAKLWNDTEAAGDSAELVERLGPAAWARSCGSVPLSAFTIAKLAWLRRVEPGVFEHVRHVMLPHDWVTWQLCGEMVTDRGDASGTGYWSPRQGSWQAQLLALVDPAIDWAPMLPRVLGPSGAAGRVMAADRHHASGAHPGATVLDTIGPGVVVGPGTGDNMAAALGLCMEPGEVAVSIGTSGTLFSVTEQPVEDPSGQVAGFADATGRFLPLVCTLNATKVTDAFRSLLGVSAEGFDQLVRSVPLGAGGVVLVPYLDGERTPNRPDARGALSGLTPEMSPATVARASVEGVVCGLLDGLDALVAAGVPKPSRLVAVGGGARSQSYRQALADLSGLPVAAAVGTELVARGAAIQAAAAVSGAGVGEVAAAWGKPTLAEVEPCASEGAAAEVREAYAAARG
ncbi:MAG: xylulokinase [Acidimicrobiales bacterium]